MAYPIDSSAPNSNEETNKKKIGNTSNNKVGLGILLSSPAEPFGKNIVFGHGQVKVTGDFIKPLPSSSSIDEIIINIDPPKEEIIISSQEEITNNVITHEWPCVFSVMDPVIKKKGGGSNLSTVCTKHGNTGYLKLEDIENSDNYTKITSNYLPYPKITHMYNNCILEFPPPRHSLYGSFDDKPPAGRYRAVHNPRRWSVFCTNEKFLKNCESCEKSLDGIDIYIYKYVF